MNQSFLMPLKASPKPRKFVAFDVEGVGGQEGFVMGSLVWADGTEVFYSPSEMMTRLTSREFRGHWLVAHNLEYDLGVLTGGDLRTLTCVFARSRLLWAETQDQAGHKWRFVDSLNIMPGTTIAQLGDMIGLPKLGLPPGLMMRLQSDLNISDLLPDEKSALIRYNVRDSEILFRSLEHFQETILSLGGRLGATLAGSSMDLFRRKYLDLPIPTLEPNLARMIRPGYYGSRVEPFKMGVQHNLSIYDVNSLYPAVQRGLAFPHPGSLVLSEYPQDFHYLNNYEGVTQCVLEVPDTFAPVIPFRHQRKLFFPTGFIEGMWTHNELRYALSQGVKIHAQDWTLWARSTFNPFTEFVDSLYKARLVAASDSEIKGHLIKLLLNSLYGRWGIDWEQGLDVLTPVTPETDWDQYIGSQFRLIGGWPYLLTQAVGTHPPAYANVMIASYISAEARLHLHRLIGQAGDSLAYCDTDAIFSQSKFDTGLGLGELKLVEDGMSANIVAPKEYSVFTGDVVHRITAKGIPLANRPEYLAKGETRYNAPLKIREAYQRGLSPAVWVSRLKARQEMIPKRRPSHLPSDPFETVQTRAWTVPELSAFDHLA